MKTLVLGGLDINFHNNGEKILFYIIVWLSLSRCTLMIFQIFGVPLHFFFLLMGHPYVQLVTAYCLLPYLSILILNHSIVDKYIPIGCLTHTLTLCLFYNAFIMLPIKNILQNPTKSNSLRRRRINAALGELNMLQRNIFPHSQK